MLRFIFKGWRVQWWTLICILWYESLRHFKPDTDFGILFIIQSSPSFLLHYYDIATKWKYDQLHGPFLCLDYSILDHFQHCLPTIKHDLINLIPNIVYEMLKIKCQACKTFQLLSQWIVVIYIETSWKKLRVLWLILVCILW